MEYEWDDHKAACNRRNHGVDFTSIIDFDWEAAMVIEDQRKDYGERRFIAYGPIGNRLHCVVFTLRDDVIRIISLRKANCREVARYG